MGPISLFALVVALCLAVMAVLAVTTARANAALAERQAAFTASDYANEAAAQELLARVRVIAKRRARVPWTRAWTTFLPPAPARMAPP